MNLLIDMFACHIRLKLLHWTRKILIMVHTNDIPFYLYFRFDPTWSRFNDPTRHQETMQGMLARWPSGQGFVWLNSNQSRQKVVSVWERTVLGARWGTKCQIPKLSVPSRLSEISLNGTAHSCRNYVFNRCRKYFSVQKTSNARNGMPNG